MTTLTPKIEAMCADENTQIKALLTAEQKPKYDAYLASMPQRGPRPAAHRAEPATTTTSSTGTCRVIAARIRQKGRRAGRLSGRSAGECGGHLRQGRTLPPSPDVRQRFE